MANQSQQNGACAQNQEASCAPLLLHACCGPCSTEPTRLMKEAGWEPTIFYANSNIHPEDEYARRLDTLRTWAAGPDAGFVPVAEGVYDRGAWEQTAGRIGDAALARAEAAVAEARAQGLPAREPILSLEPQAREARCRACYRLRFQEAAAYAVDHGFGTIATTLTVSPYQYTFVIQEELERAAVERGLQAEFTDYRPYYDETVRRSREQGMYRQNYCGCRFSDLEAQAERAERKAQRKAAREADLAAHAEERAATEAARQAKRAEKAAYAERQRAKKAALKALRKANAQHAAEEAQGET